MPIGTQPPTRIVRVGDGYCTEYIDLAEPIPDPVTISQRELDWLREVAKKAREAVRQRESVLKNARVKRGLLPLEMSLREVLDR